MVPNLLAPLVLLLSCVEAFPMHFNGPALVPPRPSIPQIENPLENIPVVSRNGTQLPDYAHVYYFNQLIDHANPSLGTFKQRYYHTYEFYEPGGPIILSTPGEVDASAYTSYLTNATINGRIAQALNGSTIVLEHRFFGASNPYNDLSVESFQVHTVQQAVDDLVYFAQNVQLPMPGGDQLAPGKAPWVLVGGSYAGALTSFTMANHPGVFTAGYASSAVVQATVDFWGYFEPIRQNMPANCSADVEAVIAHVDSVIGSNDTAAINALKGTFGLQLGHNDDFAAALLQNLYPWQSLQPDSGPNQPFYQFCDALEVQNGVSAQASGWGLDYALQAWGTYWKSAFYTQICGDDDVETCLGTYDTSNPFWTYTYTENAARSWQWLICTEFGFQFDGAPTGQPSIASRVVTQEWGLRQCTYRFPGAFGVNAAVASPNATGIESAYGGWNMGVENIVFASGTRDPWKEATVAADACTNPGSDLQPHLLSDGFHCSDMLVQEGAASASVKSVQDTAVSYVAKWISAWEPTA
ncbi:peptidase S28 [Ganoderma leucocontextum]|nr:peptidase S28 [Ganoderma leucocontextum]